MATGNFPEILALLDDGAAEITEVGIFWGQVARVRLPEINDVMLGLPATLHLEGALDNIVYAQLLVGPGLQQAWHCKQPSLAWSRRRPRPGGERIAVSSFAIPDLALHWHADRDEPAAYRIGVELASVLAEEFPNPLTQVLRFFDTDLVTLASQLAEADYQQAGTTLPRGSQ